MEPVDHNPEEEKEKQDKKQHAKGPFDRENTSDEFYSDNFQLPQQDKSQNKGDIDLPPMLNKLGPALAESVLRMLSAKLDEALQSSKRGDTIESNEKVSDALHVVDLISPDRLMDLGDSLVKYARAFVILNNDAAAELLCVEALRSYNDAKQVDTSLKALQITKTHLTRVFIEARKAELFTNAQDEISENIAMHIELALYSSAGVDDQYAFEAAQEFFVTAKGIEAYKFYKEAEDLHYEALIIIKEAELIDREQYLSIKLSLCTLMGIQGRSTEALNILESVLTDQSFDQSKDELKTLNLESYRSLLLIDVNEPQRALQNRERTLARAKDFFASARHPELARFYFEVIDSSIDFGHIKKAKELVKELDNLIRPEDTKNYLKLARLKTALSLENKDGHETYDDLLRAYESISASSQNFKQRASLQLDLSYSALKNGELTLAEEHAGLARELYIEGGLIAKDLNSKDSNRRQVHLLKAFGNIAIIKYDLSELNKIADEMSTILEGNEAYFHDLHGAAIIVCLAEFNVHLEQKDKASFLFEKALAVLEDNGYSSSPMTLGILTTLQQFYEERGDTTKLQELKIKIEIAQLELGLDNLDDFDNPDLFRD